MIAFVLVALPSLSGRRSKRTCHRPYYTVARAGQGGADMSPSWEETPNYQAMGSGVPSSGLQRVEFIIRQDGTVEETVTGVRGKHCEKLTEKIERALGRVVHTEKTDEYFQEVIDEVAEKNVDRDSVEWPGAEGLPSW